ncbi:TRAM domain-containing protein [Thalassolituus sp. LLYu03]|uniref:TRAM domain-containing protein n=1 Tax=Thalassolituus sp. LLYu03 TaxID=3421656 RepID=UPI003D2B334F
MKPAKAKPANQQPQRLTLTVDNLTSDGEGVARRNREVYFVPGALPGEEVDVVLDGRRRKVWLTRLLSVVKASPERVEPACPHYKRCGGCDLQHLSYDAQVAFKQDRVARELARQGAEVAEWDAPITAEPWAYRRKARVGVRFSKEQDGNFVGFREAASSHLTNIDTCAVLPDHPALNWAMWRDVIGNLQGRALITQIEALVADNALALIFRVLKPLQAPDLQALIDALPAAEAELPVQLWLKEDKDQPPRRVWPQEAEPLHHLVDGLPLTIQPDDFVQVNGAVNRAMVEQAMRWLNPKADEVLWDLFAGHGNFSMPLAKRCAQVYAVEGDAAMVESLSLQAEKLALPLQAKVADLSGAGGLKDLPDPHAVLLDPPRAGADGVINELISRRVPRVLYVSCDAATLARDLGILSAAGYRVVKAGIMDMFPQTHHVETMVYLEKKAKGHG